MKKALIILGILIAGILINPASANFTVIDIPPWNPETGVYTSFWFDYENGDFLPYGFLQSLTVPWTDIIGYWFFLAIWGIYIYGVWNRERAIEMTLVMMLLSGTMWGLLLPPESYLYLYLFIAMGIAAVVYKLYKSGR